MEPFREVTDTDAIMAYIFDRNKSFIGSGSAPPRGAAPAVSQAAAAEAAASDLVWQTHAACNAREAEAVSAAESGDVDKARTVLDALCSENPTRASAFNNRAQLKRMQGDAAGGKDDLDTAIRLGQEWLSRNDEEAMSCSSSSAASASASAAAASAAAASAAEGDVMHAATRVKLIAFTRRVLQQSLLQRAAYWRSQGDSARETADLEAAARYGSTLAKAVTTGMNPLATLCSDTVAIMMAAQFGKPPPSATASAAAPDSAPASCSGAGAAGVGPAIASAAGAGPGSAAALGAADSSK